MKISDPQVLDAQKLLKEIEALGYKAYIAGGAVRDLLIGEKPQDIDIATNCPIAVLKKNFVTYEIGRAKEFGTIGIQSLKLYNVWYDVTQFRIDGKYSDGRHPDNTSITNSFEEDVKRRDFTVNALGLSSDLEVIDYVDGLKDIEHKIIRAVGDPAKRFDEDWLRMLRAARFAARTGFSLDKVTKRTIKKMAGTYLLNEKPDRIRLELVKAGKRSGVEFARFILFLDDLRLLHRILPEVAAMKYFKHDLMFHPEGVTVFDHVIKCLEVMTNEPPLSKIAVLFHDLGKTIMFQEKHGWKLSYHQHEKASVELASDLADRLKFSLFHKKALIFAVENHMKFQNILDMKPSKVARLVSSDHFQTLLDVAKADEFSRGEAFATRKEFGLKIEKVFKIKDKWEHHINDHRAKLVDGALIMSLTGIKPSPMVGKIKKAVEEYVIDNNITPHDHEAIKLIILKTHASLQGGQEPS